MLKNRTNCLKSDATNLFFLLIIALCLVLLAAASASCNIGSPDNIQGIVSKNQTVSSRVPKITLPSFSPSQHSKTTAVKNMVDYSIGAGDVLSIKVFDHEELTAKARVTQAGTVDFPLIGEVHVAGLGTTAAAHRIESALANGYIIDPQVTIFIEQFKSKKVVVLGAVYNPGLVELNGSINLLELISQVGGLKDNAGETAIIKRQENGTQKDIPINLDRLIKTGDPQLNIQILGGDTVAIAEGAVCFITGEVNQPGKYLCGSDSTVFNIVTRAGSLTEKALESGIKITRTVNGIKQIMQNVTQDTVVQADDVIFVPQRPVSKEEETQCFISGEVNRPGAYPCSGKTSILKLLTKAGGLTDNALESGIEINRQVNGTKRVLRNVDKDTLLQREDVVIVPASAVKKNADCFIAGEVNRPGAYPCSRKTSMLKLLTRAGGLSKNALESGIEINRQVNGRKQVLRNINKDTLLQPDDVVIVPASAAKNEAVCYITGQVKRPGAYPCGRKTTVLKMISLAGGFTGIAAESSIEIKRIVNGKKQVLEDVDDVTLLQPEDVVVVPESFF